MVAYSFQKRFGPPIFAGTKVGTIRGPRKRHARLGEALQLFTGMRTKYCVKIMPDPTCSGCRPIELVFRRNTLISAAYPTLAIRDLDSFAQRDGFKDADDLSAFWMKAHPGTELFEGFHITWAQTAAPITEGIA